jgi:hypothetical protein
MEALLPNVRYTINIHPEKTLRQGHGTGRTHTRRVTLKFIEIFVVANIELFASKRTVRVQFEAHLLLKYFFPFLIHVQIWGKNYRIHKVSTGKAIAIWP